MGIPNPWEWDGNRNKIFPVGSPKGPQDYPHVGSIWGSPWRFPQKPCGNGLEWELKFYSHDTPAYIQSNWCILIAKLYYTYNKEARHCRGRCLRRPRPNMNEQRSKSDLYGRVIRREAIKIEVNNFKHTLDNKFTPL